MEQPQQTTPRDRNLDIYRGCVMMYIVGIIHTISIYIDWHGNTLATLMLIEMPVVFYISGAAYSLSKKKSYPKYVWNRVKRIVIPYYIFLIVITAIKCYEQCISGAVSISEFIRHFIENEYYNIFKPYYSFHLWFIPPYLKVALILPLLYYISQRITAKGIYALLAMAAIALYVVPNHEVCYAAFALAGMYYHKNKPYNKHVLLFAAIFLAFICYVSGYSLNMQDNKFPANLFFFSYTMFVLVLLKKPLQWLCLFLARTPLKHLIAIYAKHDFNIYLYHMVVISSFVQIIQFAAYRYMPILYRPAVSLPIAIVYSLVVSAIVGIVFDKLNTKITQKLSVLWNKIHPIFIR